MLQLRSALRAQIEMVSTVAVFGILGLERYVLC